MAKKKHRASKKAKKIHQSTSLLPAHTPGDLVVENAVLKIKKEPDDSLQDCSKTKSSDEEGDLSDASTIPEAMHEEEGYFISDTSDYPSIKGATLPPMTGHQIHQTAIKSEPMDYEESTNNTGSKESDKLLDDTAPHYSINMVIKKEPVDASEKEDRNSSEETMNSLARTIPAISSVESSTISKRPAQCSPEPIMKKIKICEFEPKDKQDANASQEPFKTVPTKIDFSSAAENSHDLATSKAKKSSRIDPELEEKLKKLIKREPLSPSHERQETEMPLNTNPLVSSRSLTDSGDYDVCNSKSQIKYSTKEVLSEVKSKVEELKNKNKDPENENAYPGIMLISSNVTAEELESRISHKKEEPTKDPEKPDMECAVRTSADEIVSAAAKIALSPKKENEAEQQKDISKTEKTFSTAILKYYDLNPNISTEAVKGCLEYLSKYSRQMHFDDRFALFYYRDKAENENSQISQQNANLQTSEEVKCQNIPIKNINTLPSNVPEITNSQKMYHTCESVTKIPQKTTPVTPDVGIPVKRTYNSVTQNVHVENPSRKSPSISQKMNSKQQEEFRVKQSPSLADIKFSPENTLSQKAHSFSGKNISLVSQIPKDLPNVIKTNSRSACVDKMLSPELITSQKMRCFGYGAKSEMPPTKNMHDILPAKPALAPPGTVHFPQQYHPLSGTKTTSQTSKELQHTVRTPTVPVGVPIPDPVPVPIPVLPSKEKLREIVNKVHLSNRHTLSTDGDRIRNPHPLLHTEPNLPLGIKTVATSTCVGANSTVISSPVTTANYNREYLPTTVVSNVAGKRVNSLPANSNETIKKIKICESDSVQKLSAEKSRIVPNSISPNPTTLVAMIPGESQLKLNLKTTEHLPLSPSLSFNNPRNEQAQYLPARVTTNQNTICTYPQSGLTAKSSSPMPLSCVVPGPYATTNNQKQQPTNQPLSSVPLIPQGRLHEQYNRHFLDARLTQLTQSKHVTFQLRKGVNLRYSPYKNLGREFIKKDFWKFVAQWNPSWLLTQKQTEILAPICDSYRNVRYTYENGKDFYNTYLYLMLLDIWLKIYFSHIDTPFLKVDFSAQEVKEDYIMATCSIFLRDTDVCPKRDDVILCRMRHETGTSHLFGIIARVLSRPCKPPEAQSGGNWNKMRFEFCCVEPLTIPANIEIQMLYNIRVHDLQNTALHALNDNVRKLILDPRSGEHAIDVVRCVPNEDRAKHYKSMRDRIVTDCLPVPTTKVVLVDTSLCDTVELVAYVAYALMKKEILVVVCVRNEGTFLRQVKRLLPYDPVLAVRSKEMNLTDDLVKLTLTKRLESTKKVSDIYKNCPITITQYSTLLLADCRNEFWKRDTVFILAESDMCAEPETMLPLMYCCHKFVLLGNPAAEAVVPPNLRSYGYNISLFNRLFKVK